MNKTEELKDLFNFRMQFDEGKWHAELSANDGQWLRGDGTGESIDAAVSMALRDFLVSNESVLYALASILDGNIATHRKLIELGDVRMIKSGRKYELLTSVSCMGNGTLFKESNLDYGDLFVGVSAQIKAELLSGDGYHSRLVDLWKASVEEMPF